MYSMRGHKSSIGENFVIYCFYTNFNVTPTDNSYRGITLSIKFHTLSIAHVQFTNMLAKELYGASMNSITSEVGRGFRQKEVTSGTGWREVFKNIFT